MDVNETLRQLREWAQNNNSTTDESDARELFTALDWWITSGGCIPREWENIDE